MGADQAIEALVRAFYAGFDNRAGRRIDAAGLRALFLPDARIVRLGPAGAESWSLDAFLAPRLALLSDGSLVDFHEWEVSATTHVSGRIAGRASTYAKSGLLHGAAYGGGGRKLIQLARVEAGWRIAAILWEDD